MNRRTEPKLLYAVLFLKNLENDCALGLNILKFSFLNPTITLRYPKNGVIVGIGFIGFSFLDSFFLPRKYFHLPHQLLAIKGLIFRLGRRLRVGQFLHEFGAISATRE